MNAPRLSRANAMIRTLTTTHEYGRASFRFYLNLLSMVGPIIHCFHTLNLQVLYRRCCNLIGHIARQLFRDKQFVKWVDNANFEGL